MPGNKGQLERATTEKKAESTEREAEEFGLPAATKDLVEAETKLMEVKVKLEELKAELTQLRKWQFLGYGRKETKTVALLHLQLSNLSIKEDSGLIKREEEP